MIDDRGVTRSAAPPNGGADRLTDRQFQVLRDLSDDQWLQARDVGGRGSSHHGKTLAQLVKLGLATRAERTSRGPHMYLRTPAGHVAACGARPIDLLDTRKSQDT